MKPRSPSGAATLPPPLVAFLRELGEFDEKMADDLRSAFIQMDDEANQLDDASHLLTALTRIAAMPKSLRARIDMMHDVLAQRGHVIVHIGRDTISIESRPS